MADSDNESSLSSHHAMSDSEGGEDGEGLKNADNFTFADGRRMNGERSRPMECFPIVNKSGFFERFSSEVISDDKKKKFGAVLLQNRVKIPAHSHEDLLSYIKNTLSAAEVLDNHPLLIPEGSLLASADLLCQKSLNISRSDSSTQGCILLENLLYLRAFRIELIKSSEWTPELVFAAGAKLIPEQFFADPHLPLGLLVLSIELKATGQIGNQLPKDFDEYADKIVRSWLERSSKRQTGVAPVAEGDAPMDVDEDKDKDGDGVGDGSDKHAMSDGVQYVVRNGRYMRVNPPKASRKRTKFSYIQTISPVEYRVMGRASINASLYGAALLAHVTEVLSSVAAMAGVPQRPRNRLRAVAARLAKLHERPQLRSLSPQMVLRSCEQRLMPDVAAVHAAGEQPSRVLLLAWLWSRRNLPTIITLPREVMCELSTRSLWWGVLQGVYAPASAALACGGAVWSTILHIAGVAPAATPKPEVEQAAAAATAAEDDSPVYDEPILPLSITDDSIAHLRVETEALRALGVDSRENGLVVVRSMLHTALAAGVEVSAAVEQLRAARLLREDLLAHAADAWNAINRCLRFVARLAALMGCTKGAQQIWASQRLLCNHFAPDIYPWAHVFACCHRYISGYGVVAVRERQDRTAAMTILSIRPDDARFVGTAEVRLPGKGIQVFSHVRFLNQDDSINATVKERRQDPEELVLTLDFLSEHARLAVGSVVQVVLSEDKLVVQPTLYASQLTMTCRNLSKPLQTQVMRLLRSRPDLPAGMATAPDLISALQIWDSTVAAFIPAYGQPCDISEDEVVAAMHGAGKRPPCPGTFDFMAADLPAELQRFTRSEILRVLCCLTPGGRRAVTGRVSDQPSGLALAWALLRGCDNRDWDRQVDDLMGCLQ